MTYVTLGDIAEELKKMRADGMTRGSVEYALEQVYWDQAPPRRTDVASLNVPSAELKMLREALAEAERYFANWAPSYIDGHEKHLERIGHLIAEIDRHRPLGPDGKHGELHTPTCGCEDR